MTRLRLLLDIREEDKSNDQDWKSVPKEKSEVFKLRAKTDKRLAVGFHQTSGLAQIAIEQRRCGASRRRSLGLVGPLSHAVALRTLFDRALPTLNDAARSELLLERFVESLRDNLLENVPIVQAGRAMDVSTLAEVVTDHEVSALQKHVVPRRYPSEDATGALRS
ncbi:unnamed protein product [Echinostoma caproni]|uniref:Dynamin_M domain-containing protein n=1 Tax=Echinostoma caproni TaxID=27848 RepID=A0A183AVU9_9TREM|nr:unnamed protein product [Echinostoma caproni]